MKHFLPLLGLALLAPGAALAQLTTQAGTTLYIGDGATLYSAGAVQNTGTLALGAGTLTVQGNLTNTGTVVPGSGTVVLNGAADQTLAAGGATLYRLTIDKTTAGQNTVQVPADLTISNQLTLSNGMVQTAAAAKVILPDGATVTGEQVGRYVQGNLQISRAVSGSTAVDFGPGLRINPRGQNLGAVIATRAAGLQTMHTSYAVHPQNAALKGIDQIWSIQPTQQPTAPVQLTLGWLSDNDNQITDFSKAVAWRETSPNANRWEAVGAASNATATRSISVDATQFSRWTVSTAQNPLPVELISFTAERRNDAAWLRWATATERNNNRFEVEGSADGSTFQHLGTVAGAGNRTQRTEYQYTDARLLNYGAELVYYRLRQIDADGTEHLSPVRTVRVGALATFAAVAWPLPFGADGLTLQVRTPVPGPATLVVSDALGRKVLQQQAQLAVGTSEVEVVGAGKLAAGTYVLVLQQGAQVSRLKLVRQ
ncbi:T9SS type A sorting domain-containing protein [Solirubrum puertoriconensis]|uniref:T9SS type A sorting domain-containing protein n=1 Tax=Solirubrum puertoriconensis TaxID=1751427 RepID=A0A9X0L6M0_SOLP1|nr:T9SS type A sorting domain-containing protein [Solirubrum puertoriconensis]KUG09933.1 hypothetical protein ASU33_20505 [Solirubrum puertoriconensis]